MAIDFQNGELKNWALSSAWNMTANVSSQWFSGWLNVDSFLSATQRVFLVFDSGAGGGWSVNVKLSGGVPSAFVGTFGAITPNFPIGVSASSWFHLYAEYDQANTTVKCFINGSSKYSNTAYGDDSYIDVARIMIGRYLGSGNPFYGGMAELAFGTGTLDEGQIASLAKRVSPLLVSPQTMIGYVKGLRDRKDIIEGGSFTESGTLAVSEHPPIIQPSAQIIQFPTALPVDDGFQPTWEINTSPVIANKNRVLVAANNVRTITSNKNRILTTANNR